MLSLNEDLLVAMPVVLKPHSHLHLWVVGCGGTGSFLVQLVCRIVQELIEAGKSVDLTFVDPDFVEARNITRQCFCEADVGLNKAQVLAARYSLAWGLPIRAIPEPFKGHWVARTALTVLLGCVDNGAARRELAQALDLANHGRDTPNAWWLDGGNHHHSGQVLLGSTLSTNPNDFQFHPELGCLRLPAPSIQAPNLLLDPVVKPSHPPLSCAEVAKLDEQGLLVNPQSAIVMAQMLAELLTGKLKRLATYFDLTSGTMQSEYTTQAAIVQGLQGGEVEIRAV
ncbi:MAG: ThiF family adenylyltransferase [Leptolyngbyaceae cyanobacterium bins.302]|nr:ThiF family adenylyltransferase [Leptolyngbyaceae cyanobacterium bins.302]